MAGVLGSLVGGSASVATTWMAQRTLNRRELVREEMVAAYPLDPPLAVDVGVGDDWAEAKA